MTAAMDRNVREYNATAKTVRGGDITVEDFALVIKGEVVMDMMRGIVPWSCATYSELHDYVDANCYGTLCDDTPVFEAMTHEGWPGDQRFSDFINAVQDEVNDWLPYGRAFDE